MTIYCLLLTAYTETSGPLVRQLAATACCWRFRRLGARQIYERHAMVPGHHSNLFSFGDGVPWSGLYLPRRHLGLGRRRSIPAGRGEQGLNSEEWERNCCPCPMGYVGMKEVRSAPWAVVVTWHVRRCLKQPTSEVLFVLCTTGQVHCIPLDSGVCRLGLTRGKHAAEPRPFPRLKSKVKASPQDGVWVKRETEKAREYRLCLPRGTGSPFFRIQRIV